MLARIQRLWYAIWPQPGGTSQQIDFEFPPHRASRPWTRLGRHVHCRPSRAMRSATRRMQLCCGTTLPLQGATFHCKSQPIAPQQGRLRAHVGGSSWVGSGAASTLGSRCVGLHADVLALCQDAELLPGLLWHASWDLPSSCQAIQRRDGHVLLVDFEEAPQSLAAV